MTRKPNLCFPQESDNERRDGRTDHNATGAARMRKLQGTMTAAARAPRRLAMKQVPKTTRPLTRFTTQRERTQCCGAEKEGCPTPNVLQRRMEWLTPFLEE